MDLTPKTYEIRIYNRRNWILARVTIDEEGAGESMVDRTGEAMTFRVFELGHRTAMMQGAIGGPDAPGDLYLNSRCLVMGTDVIKLRELQIKLMTDGLVDPDAQYDRYTDDELYADEEVTPL